MTRRPARGRPAALVVAVLLLAGGCVYYPHVKDTGGVHLRPENGRAVLQSDRAVFFVDLASTGKYGDVLTGATAPIAKKAELVSAGGWTIKSLEIPGESVVRFEEGGPRIVFSDLTRAVARGEVFIVTLHFEKSGPIGVITVAK